MMIVLSFTTNPKSFTITIYDGALQELRQYQLPMAVAAPLANRIVREVLNISPTLQEPWYTVSPSTDQEAQRSPELLGPTSLYGTRYQVETETEPTISQHPKAPVRYFAVRLFNLHTELYKGVYTMDDIFLHGAHYLLHHGIQKGQIPADRGPYYYTVISSKRSVPSIMSDLFPEDAYKTDGIFRLPPRVKEAPRIQFRPVPQPPLPELDPSTFATTASHGKGATQAGRVFIPAKLYADLCRHLNLSQKKEEGGYILGNVYRAVASPENEDEPDFRWMVEVTDLLMAENTVGSAAQLLFTGDSWSKISRRRDKDYPTRRLVGWFHTHLFPATDSFGLSGLDQDMHSWYLPRPWQMALLLNLEQNNERTVRCYQRGPEGELVETPFDVIETQ